MDSWLDKASTKIGKNVSEHIDPCNIPWEAIKKILNEAIYGGRLDNMVDQKILDTFIDHLMNSNSFETDFKLNICNSTSLNKDFLVSPDLFRNINDYINWTNNMSNTDLPAWLGFGQQAEGLLTTRTNFSIISKWNILYSKSRSDVYEPLPHSPLTKSLNEEKYISFEQYKIKNIKEKTIKDKDKNKDEDKNKNKENDDNNKKHIGNNKLVISSSERTESETSESSCTVSRSIHVYSNNENILFINKILENLPQNIPCLEKNEEKLRNAVFRCFERENNLFSDLLKLIKTNLNQLKNVLEEKVKYTNKIRALAKDLNSFNVPSNWLLDGNTTNLNLTNWLKELINRLYQIIVITLEFNEKSCIDINEKKKQKNINIENNEDHNLNDFYKRNNDNILSHFKLNNKEKKLSINFIWLGGLFYPRAFITATRQLSAFKFKNSLDDLELSVLIGNNNNMKYDDMIHFTITCLSIEGAEWSNKDNVN